VLKTDNFINLEFYKSEYMTKTLEITKEEDSEKFNQKALEILVNAIKDVLKTKSTVVVGLPGGESFKGLYSLLKHETRLPWDQVHLFMIDERMVSITAPESNYRVSHAGFISHLTEKEILPEENTHPFIAQEFKNQSKRIYEADIQAHGGIYDIVLLGVGEDGHIASLFPNNAALDDEESEYYVLVNDAPKLPPERISISKKMLLKAKYAIVFFAGYGKTDAFNNYQNKKMTYKECPVKLVNDIQNVHIFLDR
jgi:6-phosphogluconolactonase